MMLTFSNGPQLFASPHPQKIMQPSSSSSAANPTAEDVFDAGDSSGSPSPAASSRSPSPSAARDGHIQKFHFFSSNTNNNNLILEIFLLKTYSLWLKLKVKLWI